MPMYSMDKVADDKRQTMRLKAESLQSAHSAAVLAAKAANQPAPAHPKVNQPPPPCPQEVQIMRFLKMRADTKVPFELPNTSNEAAVSVNALGRSGDAPAAQFSKEKCTRAEANGSYAVYFDRITPVGYFSEKPPEDLVGIHIPDKEDEQQQCYYITGKMSSDITHESNISWTRGTETMVSAVDLLSCRFAPDYAYKVVHNNKTMFHRSGVVSVLKDLKRAVEVPDLSSFLRCAAVLRTGSSISLRANADWKEIKRIDHLTLLAWYSLALKAVMPPVVEARAAPANAGDGVVERKMTFI